MAGVNGVNGHANIPDGFVLTVANTVNSQSLAELLGLPGNRVPPGVEVPPSTWPLLRNLATMISSGQLQWRAPQSLKPVVVPMPPAKSVPVRMPDYIAELATRISLIMENRRIGFAEAEDWILSDIAGEKLWKAATAEFVSKARTIALPDGRVIRTGQMGHGGRSVKGFREFVAAAAGCK